MFEINPNSKISRLEIEDKNFCLIVDDFLVDPGAVIAHAREHANEFELQESGYPGMLMSVSDSQLGDIYSFIRRELSREMGFCRGGIKVATFFSMVTLPPAELNWAQRNCHTDPRTEAGHANFAGLLYLFDNNKLGGTGFYRFKNRATLEQATAIGETDPAGALQYLQERIPMFREPPKYLTISCEVAELLTVIPARLNRLIFYSGDIPHSAYIEEPDLLSDDVGVGRLTLNFFASVVPR